MKFHRLTPEFIFQQLKRHHSILTQYGIVTIGLFGSFAHQTYTRSSDIDFLIEFHPGMKTFRNYMGLKFALEEIFHRKVDLVIQSTIKSEIRDEILHSVIYAPID